MNFMKRMIQTPLHDALENRHIEIAKRLVEAGTELNAKDE